MIWSILSIDWCVMVNFSQKSTRFIHGKECKKSFGYSWNHLGVECLSRAHGLEFRLSY